MNEQTRLRFFFYPSCPVKMTYIISDIVLNHFIEVTNELPLPLKEVLVPFSFSFISSQ